MRIAYVLGSWPPGGTPNGIGTYVDQISSAQGNDECVFLPVSVEGVAPHELSRVILPTRSVGNRLLQKAAVYLTRRARDQSMRIVDSLATQINKAARKFKIDVVEMEETFGWWGELQPKVDVPIALRLHGPWFLNGTALGVCQDADYHERVDKEGIAIASCRMLTSPSMDVLRQVKTFYGVELPKARVIPNAGKRPDSIAVWDAATANKSMILYIGRFDAHKGADIMLDAFSHVAETRPDLRMVMVGPDRGVNIEGEKYSFHEYCQRFVAPNIRHKIEFMGTLSSNKVWSLRQMAGLTVIASRYETFSYAALESLLVGAPSVFSKTGGIPEIINDGVSGLGFECGNSRNLAEQIEYCLANPARVMEFSKHALEDAARFDPNLVFTQFAEYYSSLQ